ncbi:unnamed protein product [Acanthocheilonema viteae]|uniref:Uncharacterized protein n=1 Tax=Acanthocheilonema viteae TaxID=6277 RepID=A0A498SEU0_ACAVI|nr:unnamed protein product [Acanthocheilonema viteae]
MKQPEIRYHLEHNYAIYVFKYYEDLTSLRQLIMENILQKRFRSSNLTFTFESIIRGIRMQYILAVMILTNNKKDGEEELLKNMQDDVKWLKESVMPEFLTDLTDDQFDMMIKVCETYIYLWTQQLKTYNTPFAFRAELCDIQWIDNMKSSRGAIKLLTAMIELFKNLIVSANAAEGWLSICNTLNSCNLLTSNSIAEQAKIIADLVLKEFLETNKEVGIIQSPLNPRLELNKVIDFWINKILLKDRLLRCSVLAYLKDKIESLFANIVQEDEIQCYGMVIQFLLLLRNSARKIRSTSINSSMRKDTNLYETCVEVLGEQLRGLRYKYEKNEMFLHMDALFKEL